MVPDREEPVDAMEADATQLCELRPEIVNLSYEDQLAMIRACHIVDAQIVFSYIAKHKALVEWIKNTPKIEK